MRTATTLKKDMKKLSLMCKKGLNCDRLLQPLKFAIKAWNNKKGDM